MIYTIGHSNRTLEQFLELLQAHGIEKIVDVRTIPKSRHNPQFNQEALRQALGDINIEYEHLKELGGLRKGAENSINTGLENTSFRNFADYMQTKEFEQAMDKLKKTAKHKTAIMCAEALPWKCHRSLISDALALENWKVFHILDKKNVKEHKITPFVRVEKGMIVYRKDRGLDEY